MRHSPLAKEEVRRVMDLYHRKDGRFVFTAGNGINGDCPVQSLEALFEEAFAYGRLKGGG